MCTRLVSFMRALGATSLVLLALSAQAANPKDWWVDITNDRSSRVNVMLQQGADPNEVSPSGQPGLMLAIRNGSWDVYDVLVNDQKTALNAINVNRETALMYLAVVGETDRAKDLIRRGALVNRKGWTPLHYAASTGKLETAQMLLENDADVNAKAPDGTTPLMMAAYAGSEPVTRLLLDAGADVHLRTNQSYSAVDWAGFKSHTSLAQKLQALMERQTADVTAPAVLDPSPAATPSSATDTQPAPTSRYFDLDRFDEPATP